MKKRAIMSFNIVAMIPRFIFIAVVVLSVVFMVNLFVVETVDSAYAESYLASILPFISPNAFALKDNDTLRSYPFIIDLSRFNSENLEKHFKLSKSNVVAAKYTLKVYGNYDSPSPYLVAYSEVLYLYEDIYNKWAPLAKTGILGPGGYYYTVFDYDVLVYAHDIKGSTSISMTSEKEFDMDGIYRGTLKAEVVYPR